MNIETDLVVQLTAALEKLAKPSIPLEVDMWNFEMIGAYLKKNPATVRDRMACLPDFPKAHRLPTSRGRSQPLYNALEIIDWVKSYREKN